MPVTKLFASHKAIPMEIPHNPFSLNVNPLVMKPINYNFLLPKLTF